MNDCVYKIGQDINGNLCVFLESTTEYEINIDGKKHRISDNSYDVLTYQNNTYLMGESIASAICDSYN